MINTQRGVGLMEVLVAIVLLSIAVLGFVALQVRAIAASNEASMNIQATNIARDLAERIRVNRDGMEAYAEAEEEVVDCATEFCDADEMAEFDFAQVQTRAADFGMDIAVLDCQGSTLRRQCVYVAWAGTTPTNGNGVTDCTNGTAYAPNAKCIIMETYNYD